MELISQKIEIDCEKTSSVETALRSTVWKNEKFSLSEKKIRQVNYLVISLVYIKQLLLRNFCEKSVI